MSDSEDDFMSEKFLKEVPTKRSADLSYTERRRQAAARSHAKGSVQSRKQLEADAREEGLRTNLISEARLNDAAPSQPKNKALAMMMKMGFTPGQGLGATSTASGSEEDGEPARKKARTAPIDIDMRAGRMGVGIETEQQARRRKQAAMSASAGASPAQLVEASDYRARARDNFDERRAEGVLRGARRTCEELDRRTGVEASYMWLDPDQVEKDARRKRQARRLGETVSDDSDVELDPGDAYSNVVVEDGGDETSQKRLREKDAWLLLDARTRLSLTLDHLRDDHAYCLWCGCQYDSQDDMAKSCPGELEKDH